MDSFITNTYKTKDEEYINTLICIASRYIKKVASSFCKDVEDAKELSQELKIDLLRLLRDCPTKILSISIFPVVSS